MAIERGPLLYCAEWNDNPEGKVLSYIVDKDAAFTEESSDILGGVVTLNGIADRSVRNLDGSLKVIRRQHEIAVVSRRRLTEPKTPSFARKHEYRNRK